jgi:excisionase family DNA binding protein
MNTHLNTNIESEWLTVDQAAPILNLRRTRIYQLIDEGELKSFLLKSRKDSLRGKRLISRSSVADYLNKKAREAGAL